MASTVKDIGLYRSRTDSTTQGLVIAGFILSVHHRQLRIIHHLTLYKEPKFPTPWLSYLQKHPMTGGTMTMSTTMQGLTVLEGGAATV